MTILRFAATAPVNPPGASSVLTSEQVWAGLRRKVRHANEFVPLIRSCVVDRDEDGVVHRRVAFGDGGSELREVCTELAPHRVAFVLEDGTEVDNILAFGPSGEPSDLHLTYSFQWVFPNIAEGSAEAKETLAKQQKMSLVAVQSTVNTIRKMVAEGKLQVE